MEALCQYISSSSSDEEECFHNSQLKELKCNVCYKQELMKKKTLNACEMNHSNKLERNNCDECYYLDAIENDSELRNLDEQLKNNSYPEFQEIPSSPESLDFNSSNREVYSKACDVRQRIKWITADILSHPISNDRDSIIVQILNSIAVSNHGLSYDISEKYEFANVYEKRRQIRTLNRAIIKDRNEPGEIVICKPDSDENFPTVIV